MTNVNGTQGNTPVSRLPTVVRQRLATIPVQYLPQTPVSRLQGTWRDARPRRIERALAHAQGRDPGGVVGRRGGFGPAG